jgi:phosphoribosylformylglycinamidine cyclo-ligase
MHAAVGDAEWFADERRAAELADGFAEGCRQSNAVWGGGETPTLRGSVNPETIVLAGSAIGRIRPKSHRIAGDVRDGDAIIFLASSGVQTNGLTLCRTLAERLPHGYLTPVPGDSRLYGEVLLDASVIYVRFLAALQAANLRPHYAVHVTGHGWRKLMRLTEPFVYRITDIREPHPIFRFIMEHGPVVEREAYATFNMGIGLAVYVEPSQVVRYLELAKQTGYTAWQAGVVEKQGDRKAVVIEALGISFESDTLQVR